MVDKTVRIAMWSGPRNLSTAMMRSFGARNDTFVSDEPFYGAYLRYTGDDQPMREEVIASMDCDWQNIAETLSGPTPKGQPIWYQKHMVHHMVGPLDYGNLKEMRHAFLIRDPARVAASYAAKRINILPEHLGVAKQVEYFDREADRLGHAPPVIDSADVLANPKGLLSQLCHSLDISWDEAMLSWGKGRRSTDGIWASHWYGSVESSTGFSKPDDRPVILSDEARKIGDLCQPHYDYLAKHKISAV